MAESEANETNSMRERPLELETITVGALAANCYLVICPTTRQALVVDPGDEAERILERIQARGVTVVGIVHTHGHFDHISATEAVQAGLPQRVPIRAHPADAYLYTPEGRSRGAAYGYPQPTELMQPDHLLADDEVISIGMGSLIVVVTQGHTPGSVTLVANGDQFALSGDTLFRRGIGRTDLLGGDEEAIYVSIVTRLYTLPEALPVYPGHGGPTTIGEERRLNPFIRA
ncbi:MAG: MBL fold metallo-hydrolase [Ktedonobacterales bacterium]